MKQNWAKWETLNSYSYSYFPDFLNMIRPVALNRAVLVSFSVKSRHETAVVKGFCLNLSPKQKKQSFFIFLRLFWIKSIKTHLQIQLNFFAKKIEKVKRRIQIHTKLHIFHRFNTKMTLNQTLFRHDSKHSINISFFQLFLKKIITGLVLCRFPQIVTKCCLFGNSLTSCLYMSHQTCFFKRFTCFRLNLSTNYHTFQKIKTI